MQDTSGTDLVLMATDPTKHKTVVYKVSFAWNGSTYIDESVKVLALSGSSSIADPAEGLLASGEGITQTCSVTLNNTDGKFSPFNASSSIYADIKDNKLIGTPVKVEIGFLNLVSAPEYLTQFVGFVDNPGMAFGSLDTVVLGLVGQSYVMLESKQRIPLTANQRPDEWIEALLEAANVPIGSLDVGVFSIPHTWSDQDASFTEAQAAAKSEGGLFYLNKEGEGNFENAWSLLIKPDHASPVEVWTESDALNVEGKYRSHEVFNSVTVKHNPRVPGAKTRVFTLSSSDDWRIAPSATKVFQVNFRQPIVLPIDTPVAKVDYGGVTTGGKDVSELLIVTITVFAQSADVTIQNTSSVHNITMRQFELNGVPLISSGGQDRTKDSPTSAIGDPTLDPTDPDFKQVKSKILDGGHYLQTEDQAAFVGDLLSERVKNPRLDINTALAVGRPYLEILDRVTLDFTISSGIAMDVYITSIDWTIAGGAYTMSVKGVDVTGYYSYSKDEYFILNTDGTLDNKRIFH